MQWMAPGWGGRSLLRGVAPGRNRRPLRWAAPGRPRSPFLRGVALGRSGRPLLRCAGLGRCWSPNRRCAAPRGAGRSFLRWVGSRGGRRPLPRWVAVGWTFGPEVRGTEVGRWVRGCLGPGVTNDRRCSLSIRLPTRSGRPSGLPTTLGRSGSLSGRRLVRRWSCCPVRASLDRRLRVRLEIRLGGGIGLRLRNSSVLWPRRTRNALDLRVLPMPGLGAGPATGLLGGRTVGLPVRPSFDLNLRSTLELRARGGLLDARRSPMLRSRVHRCSHIRQALDRRLAGWLARGRST